MKVLIKEPEKTAEEAEIKNDLTVLQKIVGGYIEVCSPFNDDLVLICNEEGKNLELPINQIFLNKNGTIIDYIAGNYILCGTDGDDFTSLPDELISKYKSSKANQKIVTLEE